MTRTKILLPILTALMIAISSVLTGCSSAKPESPQQASPSAEELTETGKLVIYSGRKEQFIQPLIEKFTAETGIEVELLSGSASEYALKIMDERNNPQADVFFANDAGVMEKLRLEGVLSPNSLEQIEKIPVDFRAVDNSWVGLSARSRVLMYNKSLISEEEMPTSILDLADPKWKGKFVITQAGSEAMIAHLTALRLQLGDEQVEALIQGILANQPGIVKGHTDIRTAVGAGEFVFGLVNNYYYHLQLLEPSNNNVAAVYPDQEAGGLGTFVNIAGIATVKDAKNAYSARKFLEFLLQPEQQEMFAGLNFETPILPGIPVADIARPIDSYRRSPVNLSDIGPEWDNTIDLMEKAGYVQ